MEPSKPTLLAGTIMPKNKESNPSVLSTYAYTSQFHSDFAYRRILSGTKRGSARTLHTLSSACNEAEVVLSLSLEIAEAKDKYGAFLLMSNGILTSCFIPVFMLAWDHISQHPHAQAPTQKHTHTQTQRHMYTLISHHFISHL